MRRTRFDPDSPVLLGHDDGSTTIIRSPDWQVLPWRCQVRWSAGGWNEIVAIEVGWVEGSGWPDRTAEQGYGVVISGDAAPEGPHRSLSDSQVEAAMANALEGARSLELSRKVAAEVRRFLDADRAPDYASILGSADGLGRQLLDHAEVVAAIYQMLVDNGVGDPTQRLADYMGKSRPTASRRVAAARAKGLLGPARKGRAGSDDAGLEKGGRP